MVTQTEKFRRVSERLDAYPDQVIELQRQLVSRVALAPEVGGAGEADKAAFLAEVLKSWGLEVHNYPAPDDRVPGGSRPNLVAYLPGKRPEKVWVLSHTDVVPPGDPDGDFSDRRPSEASDNPESKNRHRQVG